MSSGPEARSGSRAARQLRRWRRLLFSAGVFFGLLAAAEVLVRVFDVPAFSVATPARDPAGRALFASALQRELAAETARAPFAR